MRWRQDATLHSTIYKKTPKSVSPGTVLRLTRNWPGCIRESNRKKASHLEPASLHEPRRGANPQIERGRHPKVVTGAQVIKKSVDATPLILQAPCAIERNLRLRVNVYRTFNNSFRACDPRRPSRACSRRSGSACGGAVQARACITVRLTA